MRPRVIAGMATVPARRDSLLEAVASLLPQVDELRVALNGGDEPAWLKHPRIRTRIVERGRGDAEKFFDTPSPSRRQAVRLTVDDDIVYPPDYVERTLAALGRWPGCVVSWHGRRVLAPKGPWPHCGEQLHCFHGLAEDTRIDVPGTGVLAWAESDLHVSLDAFPVANMADVWMAVLCRRLGVGVMTPSRAAGWLRPTTCRVGSRDTIFERRAKSGWKLETSLLRAAGVLEGAA